MATSLKYLGKLDTANFCRPIEQIGYVNDAPVDVLRVLISYYFVVNFNDVRIPSKNIYDNENDGIGLSWIPDGKGIDGEINEFLSENVLQEYRHKEFTKAEMEEIAERMKDQIKSSQDSINDAKAKTYSVIFDALGHQISPDEIIKMVTPDDVLKPITLDD